MMKWLVPILLVGVFLLSLTPSVTLAESSADVTVIATGMVVAAPGDFTLSYISDVEVGISWTKAPDAVNTMVRVGVGRYPANHEDGYLVYYGPDESCTDVTASLGDYTYYYAAWSEDANGIWSDWSGDDIGGFGMVLIAFALVCLALFGLALLQRRNLAMFLIVSVAWLGFGIYCLNTVNNITFGAVAIGLSVACAFWGLLALVSGQRARAEEPDEYITRIRRIGRRSR